MSTAIESFLGNIKDTVAIENTQISADYLGAMSGVAKAVENWCNENGLTTTKKVGKIKVAAANESFDCDTIGMTIGADKIVDLCKSVKVAPEHLEAAAIRVGALLSQTLGKQNAADTFETYNAKTTLDTRTFSSVESLYPQNLHLTTTGSLESFGINMDRVQADLKTILTIALLQFHTNLTPRIVPVQTVTQGNVTIVRESMEVFDLQDPKAPPTRVIELYKDPSMVSVKAQRIVPLKSNDAEGKFLKADDLYLFEKEINMFDMALDANKAGFDKYNHTDLVEDNIVLDGVLIKIAYTGADGEKVFYRLVPVPAAKGRLTQISNDFRSTDRRLALDHFPVRIVSTDAADTKSGETSDVDAQGAALATKELVNGVGLAIDLRVNVHVDRRTSKLDASAWVADYSIRGGALDDAAREELLKKFAKPEIIAFTLDARYNEDNKRKTSIRAEMMRRSMSYELPAGRNFVVDSAIGQDGVLNASARLAQLEHIGRDYNNLKIIEDTMKAVHDQVSAMNNDQEARDSLAAQYAAGDLVNPYVYTDELNYSNVIGVRSSDISGDLKAFGKNYQTRLTSALLNRTFFAQQLAAGAPIVFRCITSPEVLGDLIMCKHIHAHLENDQAGTGGVEHIVNLDNGVKLEFVTTTFDSMANKIILLPYLANSQSSVLNFGTDYDQGTLVGALSMASDGGPCYHRMFSCTRELLIPTNVMGAVVSITGFTNIVMNDATNSTTVLGVNAD